jgi:hypothetical protein
MLLVRQQTSAGWFPLISNVKESYRREVTVIQERSSNNMSVEGRGRGSKEALTRIIAIVTTASNGTTRTWARTGCAKVPLAQGMTSLVPAKKARVVVQYGSHHAA